jgi:hypothetical protein
MKTLALALVAIAITTVPAEAGRSVRLSQACGFSLQRVADTQAHLKSMKVRADRAEQLDTAHRNSIYRTLIGEAAGLAAQLRAYSVMIGSTCDAVTLAWAQPDIDAMVAPLDVITGMAAP